MEPARVRADDLGDRGGKSNHVMPYLSLYFLDAFELKIRALANGFRGFLRNQACLGECFCGGQFNG